MCCKELQLLTDTELSFVALPLVSLHPFPLKTKISLQLISYSRKNEPLSLHGWLKITIPEQCNQPDSESGLTVTGS